MQQPKGYQIGEEITVDGQKGYVASIDENGEPVAISYSAENLRDERNQLAEWRMQDMIQQLSSNGFDRLSGADSRFIVNDASRKQRYDTYSNSLEKLKEFNSKQLRKLLNGTASIEDRTILAGVLTAGRSGDERYRAYLENVDTQMLNQLSKVDRFEVMFEFFATGINPKSTKFEKINGVLYPSMTFTDGPIIDALSGTESIDFVRQKLSVDPSVSLENVRGAWYDFSYPIKHTNQWMNNMLEAIVSGGNMLEAYDPRGYMAMNKAGENFSGNVGGWFESRINSTLGVNSNWSPNNNFDWDQHFIGGYSVEKAYITSTTKMQVRASNATSWISMTPYFANSYTDSGPFRNFIWNYHWSEAFNGK